MAAHLKNLKYVDDGKGHSRKTGTRSHTKLLHEQSPVCMLAGKHVLNFTMIYDIV